MADETIAEALAKPYRRRRVSLGADGSVTEEKEYRTVDELQSQSAIAADSADPAPRRVHVGSAGS